MTESQCIEIVEKVWGWTWFADANNFPPKKWEAEEVGVWFDENKQPLKRSFINYKKDVVEEYVNSWQGFGRTLESMFKKDDPWLFSASENLSVMFHRCIGQDDESLLPIHEEIEQDIDPPFSPEKMIEATHLAALEALK